MCVCVHARMRLRAHMCVCCDVVVCMRVHVCACVRMCKVHERIHSHYYKTLDLKLVKVLSTVNQPAINYA